MSIITCTVAEDGTLTPSTVEFEPGDTIRFKSDPRVHLQADLPKEIEVNRAFNLSEISATLHDGTVEITFSKRWEARDLRLPPPPPPGVTIVVGHPKGSGQAGAAGTGS
jgi:hypothetical protein